MCGCVSSDKIRCSKQYWVIHSGAMVSTAASQQDGLGFESGLSVRNLHDLPVHEWVFSGHSGLTL